MELAIFLLCLTVVVLTVRVLKLEKRSAETAELLLKYIKSNKP